MRLVVIVAAAVTSLLDINLGLAHDLTKGRNMGFPPGAAGSIPKDLVPPGVMGEDDDDLRGVFNAAVRWPQSNELIICFRSGTRKARARVAEGAKEWMQYVNLRLNLGDGQNFRSCKGDNSEHIKIDFLNSGPDAGHWSYVGTQSAQMQHSMNLQGLSRDDLPRGTDLKEARRIVLHEFGHALGFEHEHQNPSALCHNEFDMKEVTSWARRLNWNSSEVERNLLKLQPSTSLKYTRHDQKSVMHYSLPEKLLKNGRSSRCWVEVNFELSEGDKNFARELYPKPVAGISASDEDLRGSPVPRSAAPDRAAAEASFRERLIELYEARVKKAGVPASSVAEFVGRFRKHLEAIRKRAEAGP